MQNYLQNFAHAESEHNGASDSFTHLFEDFAFALGFWVLIIAVLYVTSVYVLKLSRAHQLLLFSFIQLVYGVFLYDKSPGFAAIIVSIGFATTLVSVLIGIQAEPASNSSSKGE